MRGRHLLHVLYESTNRVAGVCPGEDQTLLRSKHDEGISLLMLQCSDVTLLPQGAI